MQSLSLLCWTVWIAVIHADPSCIPTNDVRNSEGVCVSNNNNNNNIVNEAVDSNIGERIQKSYDGTCPIWDFNQGLVLSGRNMKRNDLVQGLFPDIMINWKQHSARSFPRWGRHHYFFRNPVVPLTVTTEFIFAPGYKYPVQCHSTYSNLEVNYTDVFVSAFTTDTTSKMVALNPPIRTDRAIAIGDPLYLPCIDPTLSIRREYDVFPPQGHTTASLQKHGEYCYDMGGIYIKEIESVKSSTTTTTTDRPKEKQYGTFASRLIEGGNSITWGELIPMHRSELRDPVTGKDELLLNYCYSPDRDNYTSSLLLLPIAPGANGMNHADRNKNQIPNVEVMWMSNDFNPNKFFQDPTETLFGDTENSSREREALMIEYVAIRDIQEGEELLIDYGDAWQEAWDAYNLQQQQESDGPIPEFRQPIGLPKEMIPTKWLEKESIAKKQSHREWFMPKLQAGELQGMKLSDGIDVDGNDDNIKDTRQITGMVDRVGLPDGLAEFMAKWADEMGITSVLKSHVRGELQLPPEGERRLRLNGSTWWVKRFPSNWRSDMHYISPDDFESNQMFMNALADAGFDTVLKAIGTRDNLTSITVYYPSYIAVSHCTSAMMHNDSEEDGHYNVIFPVLQVNNSKPELIVGDEDARLFAPYKYEPDHAVVLGKGGYHGTAPCDYRGTDSIRMVVSVYMLDGDNEATRKKVLKDWIDSDPPYPRVPDRDDFISDTKHWKRDDPERNLKNPLVSESVSSE